MKLKENIKKLKDSDRYIIRKIYAGLFSFWQMILFFSNESFRSNILTKWKYGKLYYQQATFTIPNRYPLIFNECAKYLMFVERPKILSFGCSTGEEVFSIGELISNAEIIGVDINQWCLKQCRKKNKNTVHSFFHRFSKEFESLNDIDAIFCMAVFQRTENRTSKKNFTAQNFSFTQFESEILVLDKKLKPGGLLVIDQTDYSFTDTICAKNYTPLSFDKNQLFRNRPHFDRNKVKIAEFQNYYRVFVKS